MILHDFMRIFAVLTLYFYLAFSPLRVLFATRSTISCYFFRAFYGFCGSVVLVLYYLLCELLFCCMLLLCDSYNKYTV